MVNFCFLNNADNQKIKDKDPNVYKDLLPTASINNILESAICPINSLDLTYDNFLTERINKLVDTAKRMIE